MFFIPYPLSVLSAVFGDLVQSLFYFRATGKFKYILEIIIKHAAAALMLANRCMLPIVIHYEETHRTILPCLLRNICITI